MSNANQSLQDILDTLSTFTNPQFQPAPGTATSQQTQSYFQPAPPDPADDDDGEYDPTNFDPSSYRTAITTPNEKDNKSILANYPGVHAQPVVSNTQYGHAQPYAHQHQTVANPTAFAAPRHTDQNARQVISPPPTSTNTSANLSNTANNPSDPRNITTWSAAMAYTRTHLLSSATNIAKLRKLIANQTLNERQWWAGREALLRQQRERGTRRSEINDVLRAVGGKVADGDKNGASRDEREAEETEAMTAELRRYDLKVHVALAKMVEGMLAELRGLGVPFFCTRGVLVRTEADDGGDEEKGEETISKATLERLQRRMLDYLEVSCQE